MTKYTDIEKLETLLMSLTKEAKSLGLPKARIDDIDTVKKAIKAVVAQRSKQT
jgi:cell division ATPase FtsA